MSFEAQGGDEDIKGGLIAGRGEAGEALRGKQKQKQKRCFGNRGGSSAWLEREGEGRGNDALDTSKLGSLRARCRRSGTSSGSSSASPATAGRSCGEQRILAWVSLLVDRGARMCTVMQFTASPGTRRAMCVQVRGTVRASEGKLTDLMMTPDFIASLVPASLAAALLSPRRG